MRRRLQRSDGGFNEGPRGGAPRAVDLRKNRPDRNALADWNEDVRDDALLEDFDFYRALLRLDHRDDVAEFDAIAGLHKPLDERAGLHVGAERGHFEIAHNGRTSSRATATIVAACGRHASSRCAA